MQSQTHTEDGKEGEPGKREVIFICRTNKDLGNGEPKMSFQLTPLKLFFLNKELVFLKEIKGGGAAGGREYTSHAGGRECTSHAGSGFSLQCHQNAKKNVQKPLQRTLPC